jgi:hypothetical protein
LVKRWTSHARKKNQIIYGIKVFEERNNFLHRNFSKLGIEFELKPKEALGFEIQYNLMEFS